MIRLILRQRSRNGDHLFEMMTTRDIHAPEVEKFLVEHQRYERPDRYDMIEILGAEAVPENDEPQGQ